MKPINTFLTILFISLLSSPSWSETMDDLVERNDLYYEKFTNVPFSGIVTGHEQGSFKNGEKVGDWVGYHENGQLSHEGNYKNGKKVGDWVSYHENGQLSHEGNYKNGKKVGDWVGYFKGGGISYKGNFKNGKREGVWIHYMVAEFVFEELTGTFKDGVKISD